MTDLEALDREIQRAMPTGSIPLLTARAAPARHLYGDAADDITGSKLY